MISLLVATKKGAWILKSDKTRSRWKTTGPLFLGHEINHLVQDPREPKVLSAAAKTGHLGPTLFRSLNGGKSWIESKTPPQYAKSQDRTHVVKNTFWLSPGHASEKQVWYAGTNPLGLFRSENHGETWEEVKGFNENPEYKNWEACGATPGGQLLHSILIDPRDPKKMLLGISTGGVFESPDQGKTWNPLNKGQQADFLPSEESALIGQDPHLIIQCPSNPDRFYQQNHCGIYRLDRPSDTWVRIGKNMPKNIGDIGFPIVVHPRDENRVFVFPMDGTEVWPRTSPHGKPAVFMSTNGGKSWKKKDSGFPKSQGWFTVYRQSMCSDQEKSLGLYLGTTSGEVWATKNEASSWKMIVSHLPQILSVTCAYKI